MPAQVCDRCQARWNFEWKCQVICPNCGARQDCSDLFVDHERVRAIRASIKARKPANPDTRR
jgi:uncharacterized Zn finger protein (UPF0148 family)